MYETVGFISSLQEELRPDATEYTTPQETKVCSVAIADLYRLGQELQIEPTKIELLASAISTYATEVKPEPISDMDCYMEVGRCMAVPCDFRQFCKKTFELDVETGAYVSRTSRGSINFYHEVNVMGDIVIDWTAKQFSQDRGRPYPLVYLNGEDDVRASWGPLGTRQF